jgi:hypothetical protein
MAKRNLIATAPTLDDIREAATRFYCGESKTLIPAGDNVWNVVSTATGRVALGVRVVRQRGRYRFEMT